MAESFIIRRYDQKQNKCDINLQATLPIFLLCCNNIWCWGMSNGWLLLRY